MATKNPRVNVTFETKTIDILNDLAKAENKSISNIIRELTNEALELREDYYFSKLAEKLDQEGVKTYTHEEVWKKK